jgi:hypothetical protein
MKLYLINVTFIQLSSKVPYYSTKIERNLPVSTERVIHEIHKQFEDLGFGEKSYQNPSTLHTVLTSVVEPEPEPEPQGAASFGRSRSRIRSRNAMRLWLRLRRLRL